MATGISNRLMIMIISVALIIALAACESEKGPGPIIDTKAPAMVSGFQVDSVDQGTVWFSWKSTGDDSLTGTAKEYHLHYSTEYTSLLNNWNNATAAPGLPTPQAPGNDETYELIDLPADTTYYFAIKAADEAGNISAISDIDSAQWHSPIGLKLPDLQVDNCSEVQVSIAANKIWDVAGLEIHIQYDPAQVTYDSVTSDYLVTGMMADTTAGLVHIIWADINNLLTVPNGEAVAVIHFSDLTGTSQLTFDAETEIVDYAGDPIILELNNGSMECSAK